jgi:hypothetical protein
MFLTVFVRRPVFVCVADWNEREEENHMSYFPPVLLLVGSRPERCAVAELIYI